MQEVIHDGQRAHSLYDQVEGWFVFTISSRISFLTFHISGVIIIARLKGCQVIYEKNKLTAAIPESYGANCEDPGENRFNNLCMFGNTLATDKGLR